MKCVLPAALIVAFAAPFAAVAYADQPAKFELTLKDHKFEPGEIHVPAGKAFTIEMTNTDATAEEFSSDDLKVEKVAAGGRKVLIRVPPQQPGRYKFDGEYHEKTAQGVVIAE